MRYPLEETAEKHERIVRVASELFRERGFDDVTVAEVMKAGGLTHGAFYSHFPSKEALMAAAVEYGMEATLAGIKKNSATATTRAAYLNRYLSTKHRDNPAQGCTMSALSGDIRNEPEVQHTFSTELKAILEAMGGNRGDAIFTTAAMVGAMVLARAGDDDSLSKEILSEVRKRLTPKSQA
ncbi:TetR/AcrR family transcriptional regulator [Granulicella sibirica]|uniref:Regulatory protein, TetR n=1 Tax=Granulicella sibirica TaxID=2479048 RepID=A0A4Q0T1G9_9BACT|nr:TetR/AcrR family transcriptional regulator [Granulicella sibirica]RXH57485.1 regulatory protein, TetR [Granulicella sibirica]